MILRLSPAILLATSVACAPSSVDLDGNDTVDQEDVPEYQGGWPVDAECRNSVEPTGDGVGDVLPDFELRDQYGDMFRLHDFCNHVLFIYASFFG
jgi:hypothetical protein